jgi:F-type H+-transporting ATPase subunit gamma
MPEIFEIKTRIEGLKSIHNITYAMQIVTISRLKRITMELQKVKASFLEAKKIVGQLLVEDKQFANEFLTPIVNSELPPVFILFFSNRGFCGSFNQDIFSQFTKFCHELGYPADEVQLLLVGKKATTIVKNHKNALFFAPSKDLFTPKETQNLYERVQEYIAQGRRIYSVQFEFKSIITQRITCETIFPVSAQNFKPYMKLGAPIYLEPDKKTVQTKMAGHYFRLKLMRSIQDSTSSEFSQRFLLMKSAVENVKSLSEELHVNLNKERQRMITQEISEIISTFKALKKKK